MQFENEVLPSETCMLTVERPEKHQCCRQVGCAFMPMSPPSAGEDGLGGG